jgi:hypothetical protein
MDSKGTFTRQISEADFAISNAFFFFKLASLMQNRAYMYMSIKNE